MEWLEWVIERMERCLDRVRKGARIIEEEPEGVGRWEIRDVLVLGTGEVGGEYALEMEDEVLENPDSARV